MPELYFFQRIHLSKKLWHGRSTNYFQDVAFPNRLILENVQKFKPVSHAKLYLALCRTFEASTGLCSLFGLIFFFSFRLSDVGVKSNYKWWTSEDTKIISKWNLNLRRFKGHSMRARNVMRSFQNWIKPTKFCFYRALTLAKLLFNLDQSAGHLKGNAWLPKDRSRISRRLFIKENNSYIWILFTQSFHQIVFLHSLFFSRSFGLKYLTINIFYDFFIRMFVCNELPV